MIKKILFCIIILLILCMTAMLIWSWPLHQMINFIKADEITNSQWTVFMISFSLSLIATFALKYVYNEIHDTIKDENEDEN